MNLVIGAPVSERAWVLPEWLYAIESQDINRDEIDLDVVCVMSPSNDNTEKLLVESNVIVLYDERPGRTVAEIDGHAWGATPTYQYMASLRNRLTDYAISLDADYFLSLDSDIILPPGGLRQLLDYSADNHPGVVSPAVNMATGETVWNTMQWADPAYPGLAQRILVHPQGGPVDVVMAAMLLDRLGMECLWAAHGQGEDVGFCVDAAARSVPRWWCPDVVCPHRMRRA